MTHTPGPWKVDYDNSERGQWYTAGPAQIYFRYNAPKIVQDTAEDNALLIAAAPDLLEALENLTERCERARSILHKGPDFQWLMLETTKERDIIAKARQGTEARP